MKNSNENFQSQMTRLFNCNDKAVRTITFQITDECNLCCSYCYQINKGTHTMEFETAKKCIDFLLEDKNDYINSNNTLGIVIEFIGGEPLLKIELIEKITKYFLDKMIKEKHPWLLYSRFSICSNGTLYFNEKFQNYLKKYINWISFDISIDGNKELHDSCRLFPDGSGSYDLAIQAAQHFMTTYQRKLTSKITFSSNYLKYLNNALKNLISLGYTDIIANCPFENIWNLEDPKILYLQMKEFSDYILENNLDTLISCSLYSENLFTPIFEEEDKNWCGGNGEMLAINYTGNLYPCLRYMESSLGNKVEPIIIGHIDRGIGISDKEKDWIKRLKEMTRISQSDNECINCQIGTGCSWCSAFNYQDQGKLNKRVKYICQMHQARALGNYYYWNKYYRKHKQNKRKEIFIPKEWALKIIDEKEWKDLILLSKKEELL